MVDMGSVLTRPPTKVSIQSHKESVLLFLWNGRLTTPSFVVKYYSLVSPCRENHNHSIINSWNLKDSDWAQKNHRVVVSMAVKPNSEVLKWVCGFLSKKGLLH